MPTLTEQIAAGSDDCYIMGASFNGTSYNVSVGSFSGFVINAGMRWDNNLIPPGVSVVAVLRAYISTLGTISAKIRGCAEDDAATWSAGSTPNDRPKTTAEVSANTADWDNWGLYNFASIDISPVVQEIIDRAGWAYGNAIAITIEDVASADYVNFSSYESAPALSGELALTFNYPKLHLGLSNNTDLLTDITFDYPQLSLGLSNTTELSIGITKRL